VLELAGIGPGPYACMLLADLGADVLRLERGDADAEPSTSWDVLNRSRHSVAVDLKNPSGRDLVLELCEQADVLIEGFRPGVTERLGLGPGDVRTRNPRLVYGRMTGYGQQGPLAQRAGHDINYIAVSGALWPVGRSGQSPVAPLNLVGDFGGGALFLAFGVVAVNILDSGAHFYEVYETMDARFVAVGAIEPQFYEALLAGLGLDAASLPAQLDRAQWPSMKERFATIFHSKTRDEWTEIFADVDACVTPVLSPREAAHHPYNTERGVFATDGPVQPQPAPRFSKTPGSIGQPPRTPGSGTREGLASWGISEERLAALRSAGAFG
jgi:alpha-methylacyl-CoA racemase